MLDRSTVDRLRSVDTAGAPVLSVYLNVGADLTDLRTLRTRLKGLVRPVRDLVEGGMFDSDGSISLKADLEDVVDAAARVAAARGRGVALFRCGTAGLDEVVALPGPVRERAVADRIPYLSPMEAMLSHYRRYCAIVADRRTASIYRFAMGDLEAWEAIGEEEVRKENYGGFGGFEERAVRGHAEEVARRLFRAAADRVAALLRGGEFDLLMVGGNQVNVAGVTAELGPEAAARLAGTFTLDPGTATPSDVAARCAAAAEAHEARTAAEEVAALLDAAAAGERAVVGLEGVTAAANQRAIARLVVAPTRVEPGVACLDCGWLAAGGALCGYCGERTVVVPDLIDRLAARAAADGGEVRYVLGETALGDAQVAARLRFQVVAAA